MNLLSASERLVSLSRQRSISTSVKDKQEAFAWDFNQITASAIDENCDKNMGRDVKTNCMRKVVFIGWTDGRKRAIQFENDLSILW